MMKEKEFLAKTDQNPHTYDEFETFLIEKSKNHPFPQTEFQCSHFVAGSQQTLYKQIRQTLMEIDTRKHSIEKIEIAVRKTNLEMKKNRDAYEKSDDPYEKEMLDIELDDMKIDMGVYEKKLEQSHTELKYFLNIVKNVCSTEEDTDKYFELNSEEEKKYWIARMAKQSSVDLIAYGRLGAGNIDSILMMPEEDQVATLQLALNYAGAISAGVEQMKLNAEAEIKFLRDELPDTKYLETNAAENTNNQKLLKS